VRDEEQEWILGGTLARLLARADPAGCVR